MRCNAHERQRPQQLCRHIARSTLADEPVQINSAGPIVLKLKTALCDSTTRLVMSPLEFMHLVAMLVPRLHSMTAASRLATP